MKKEQADSVIQIPDPYYSKCSMDKQDGHDLGLVRNEKKKIRSSHCASVETILTSIHEDASIIPGHAQWAKDLALP